MYCLVVYPSYSNIKAFAASSSARASNKFNSAMRRVFVYTCVCVHSIAPKPGEKSEKKWKKESINFLYSNWHIEFSLLFRSQR